MRYGAWDTNHLRDIIMSRYYCIHKQSVNHISLLHRVIHIVHDVAWPKAGLLSCTRLHAYYMHSYMTMTIYIDIASDLCVCILFQVVRMVDDGYRLPPPPGCPREIYHLMIQCW